MVHGAIKASGLDEVQPVVRNNGLTPSWFYPTDISELLGEFYLPASCSVSRSRCETVTDRLWEQEGKKKTGREDNGAGAEGGCR